MRRPRRGRRVRSGAGDDATTVKVGYLHTIAVDDKLWLGQIDGQWADHDLNIETTEFATGIELSRALAGGSLDVAIMGGVTSNFPAQGRGQVIMLNSIENATARLYAAPGSGIESAADLKGKTPGHDGGHDGRHLPAPRVTEAGIDRKQVDVVNAKMPDAVQAFVGGSADAIALWVPFDLRVQEGLEGATEIDDAGNYPDAAVGDGWIANNEWYAENEDTVRTLIDAWLDINDDFRADPEGSLEKVHAEAYEGAATLEDLTYRVGFQTDYSNEEWLAAYEDGTVLDVVGTAEQAYVELGGVPTYVEPSEFFDTSLFIEQAKAHLE
ncbi:ABC transporter substrate-binding protein [Nocardioides sp. B-3]|uniref:ABC transporter substrate-binding protein n=1 Tax=Nocardioides sp. B-3 TaxID=2895565 RepID=UPI0021521BBF|nr:ABC transporter substrate-binding protein [Nocardioides sp. B-3]UUZ58411.1 ABC transporter substrate-binding protein [Nocardioides sp. B-3]